MDISKAYKALKAGELREARVGATEALRLRAKLASEGVRTTSEPVRVGGLIVSHTIRRV